MNKKYMEYLIIGLVILLLLYACYSFAGFKFKEKHENVTDSIEMYYPSSSHYVVDGDTVKFRNSFFGFYDMDVSKLSSSDERVEKLLYHSSNVRQRTTDYINESYYLITIEYPDENGYKYHSMIIPLDSFNKQNLTFSKETDLVLFDGHDRKFVVDSAFNSQVVI